MDVVIAIFALALILTFLTSLGNGESNERAGRRQIDEIRAVGDRSRREIRALGEESRALMEAIAKEALTRRGGGDGGA